MLLLRGFRMKLQDFSSTLKQYINAGFYLVPIHSEEKGPTNKDWTKERNMITPLTLEDHIAHVKVFMNIGLAHIPSHTCCIDIDKLEDAKVWLSERSINLDGLLNADDAVQITRGDPERGKLVYRVENNFELPTVQVKNDERDIILEFRRGSKDGITCQDILPPSRYPKIGKDGLAVPAELRTYKWAGKGQFNNLPLIPEELIQIWESIVAEKTEGKVEVEVDPVADIFKSGTNEEMEALLQEVEKALEVIQTKTNYMEDFHEWIKIGMSLKRMAGKNKKIEERLRKIYENASRKSPKWNEEKDSHRWNGFGEYAPGGVTFRHVFHLARENGYVDTYTIKQELRQEYKDEETQRYKFHYVPGEPLTPIVKRATASVSESSPPSMFNKNRQAICLNYDNDGIPTTEVATRAYAAEILRKNINVYEIKRSRQGDYESPIDPVKVPELVNLFLEQNAGVSFPPLNIVSGIPFLTEEGEVVSSPGYFSKQGIYYIDTGIRIDKVTGSDADLERAFELLNRVYQTFPFVHFNTELSASIAYLVSTFVTHFVDSSPAFIFSASRGSEGKTLLSIAPSLVHYGKAGMNLSALPPTGDNQKIGQTPELGKTIFSMLSKGVPFCVLDNLPTGINLQSESLAKAITSDYYEERKMYTQTMLSIKASAIWAVNGINVSVKNDLATRFLQINLDSKMEHPEQRSFSLNETFEQVVLNSRAGIIWSCLTILKNWLDKDPEERESIVAGLPSSRFSKWDSVVRGAILNAGWEDPYEANKNTFSVDTHTNDNITMCLHCIKLFDEGRGYTVRDIIDTVVDASSGATEWGEDSTKFTYQQVESAKALLDIWADGDVRRLSPRKLLNNWFHHQSPLIHSTREGVVKITKTTDPSSNLAVFTFTKE